MHDSNEFVVAINFYGHNSNYVTLKLCNHSTKYKKHFVFIFKSHNLLLVHLEVHL